MTKVVSMGDQAQCCPLVCLADVRKSNTTTTLGRVKIMTIFTLSIENYDNIPSKTIFESAKAAILAE